MGYETAAYAESLVHVGRPLPLSHSGGWLLERPIPGTGLADARGPYPLFCCPRWEGLEADLEDLQDRIVSLVLVTDPFCPLRRRELGRLFPDRMQEYKTHYLVEPARLETSRLPPHHRRNLRRAAREVEVSIAPARLDLLETWCSLYGVLVARHGIRGPARFSRASFARQLTVPGMLAVQARRAGRTVAMQLWLRAGSRAYYHLGASAPEGYRHRAAYAMFHAMLEHFAGLGVEVVDLGAGAGVRPRGDDGLTRFKRGWATATRTVYLCGRVFDRSRYRCLAAGAAAGGYFPAYRAAEAA